MSETNDQYDWTVAHAAVFQSVLLNLRAALASANTDASTDASIDQNTAGRRT